MRKAILVALVAAVGYAPPAGAAGPDLSAATLTRLDDRLWDAGDEWREIFDDLPRAQQEALVALNAIVLVVEGPVSLRPPDCGECEEVEKTAESVHPVAARRPVERQPSVYADAPDYQCGNAQRVVTGLTITGKPAVTQADWMDWCIDGDGAFAAYHYGHSAATYGWGWQVGGCICQQQSFPPVPGDERQHTFYAQQSYHRQFGLMGFGFTDHHDTWNKGSIASVGAYRWAAAMTGT